MLGQRDNSDADGAAHQAGDHPWPPHAQRDAVRSLIRPKNGLPTRATRAPIAAISAKLFGAC